MIFIICSLSGSHSWTRTNDILINSQALYRLSYAGIFNFILYRLSRLSFCHATLLPAPFPSPSFGSLRGNPSGAVPTSAMREYSISFRTVFHGFLSVALRYSPLRSPHSRSGLFARTFKIYRNASTYLSSRGVATQVFSALLSLTSVFGMGTGGS